ncbi:store-operated calcium entry-associated regulatory factor-like [Branchiostoma floridae x Branchiostoma belcheri]
MKLGGEETSAIPLVAVVIVSLVSRPSLASSYGGERVLLEDVKVLTLYNGRMTNSRRAGPVPQLKCVGGSAGCSSFVPQVVQCTNQGSDGYDIQWECKTDMDNAYRFGYVEVSCEGYDYPDDPYILRGSCGLEYTLDFTKEGYEKQNSGGAGYSHDYYGDETSHYGSYGAGQGYHGYKKTSWFGDLVFLGIVALVGYAIYQTCIASPHEGTPYPDSGTGSTYRPGGPSAPPPPGFRQDYMPGSSGCSSSYDSGYTGTGTSHSRTQHTQQGTGGGFGGFWGGAATGGLLGYLFGSGNRGYGGYGGYGGYNHYPRHTAWGPRRTGWSSWFGPSTGGYRSTGGFGGGAFGGGRASFGGGSSGTRTASGFGGTKRR